MADERDTLVDSVRELNNPKPDQNDDPPEDQNDPPEDAPEDQPDDQDDAADDQRDRGDEDTQQLSRGQERIRNQARINAAERERAERAERDLAAERARNDERARIGAEEAQRREAEEERVAFQNMSESERAVYLVAKSNKKLEDRFVQMERRNQDANDRAQFDNLVRSDKRFEKFRAEVERMYTDIQRQGGFLAREVILDTLVGRDMRTNGTRTQQRQDAQDRVERERTRNRTPRGAPPPRGGDRKLSHVQRMERADPKI